MASTDSLNELLQEELKDIYDAEKQLTKALPKMAKKASNEELKQAFEEHFRQTEQHVERLEQAFEQLEMSARAKRCAGMKSLISEGEDMIGDAGDQAARDAVMIASAQKVEHYEIASYGTLRTWANLLGQDEVASLLEETLEEEKQTDYRLTEIAEQSVNEEAVEGEETRGARRGRQPRGRVTSARSNAARTASARGSRQQAADLARRRRR